MSVLNGKVGIISDHFFVQFRERAENEKLSGDSVFLYITDFYCSFRLLLYNCYLDIDLFFTITTPSRRPF